MSESKEQEKGKQEVSKVDVKPSVTVRHHKKKDLGKGTTELALMVSSATMQEIDEWDKDKIVQNLITEITIPMVTAREVADKVEDTILKEGWTELTTTFIRELIDIELMRRNLKFDEQNEQQNITVSMHDIEQVITNANNENSNTTHNPESVNLTLAETLIKQFSLSRVFSEPVAEAHKLGDIHLHDLGFAALRPYCGGHSLEYVKKYGLDIPSITSTSAPAKRPEVLIGHMVKMASILQSNYAGAVGWDAVNMFFAPLLTKDVYLKSTGVADLLTEEQKNGKEVDEGYHKWVKQCAQMLVFEFNQLAGARGGQTVFSDFNLYYNIPAHYAETPAVGPGGKYMVKLKDGEIARFKDVPSEDTIKETGGTLLRYKDFEKESQLFITSLYQVYQEGDSNKKTFFFPKPMLHIGKEFFETKGWEKFLNFVSEVAAEQGTPYFVYDRGDGVSVSQCCRLKLDLTEAQMKLTDTPERLRFSALQNVTINMPRIAYKADGDDKKLFDEIDRLMELVGKAHIEKKHYINGLMSLGERGPLSMLAQGNDGHPYMDMDNLTFLVGLIGLNEMVATHTGKELHETEKAVKFGLKVVAYMNRSAAEVGKKYGIKMILEESPAESAGYRLAKLDMKYFPEKAKKVLQGSLIDDNYYYTNSIHLAYASPVDYVKRVETQSRFHPLIDAGAIVHIWLGEKKPSPKAIRDFVVKTYENTEAEQIAFSPEFTTCEDCNKTSRGLNESCPHCGSYKVYWVTRIVGYFSLIKSWNKAKLAELKDRKRGL